MTLTSAFAQDGWQPYDGPGPDDDGSGGGPGGGPAVPVCVEGVNDFNTVDGGYFKAVGANRALKVCATEKAPQLWEVVTSTDFGAGYALRTRSIFSNLRPHWGCVKLEGFARRFLTTSS